MEKGARYRVDANFHPTALQEMGVPKLNVSYKPQKISPKFEGTVRQLLHAKIRDAYVHPQVRARARASQGEGERERERERERESERERSALL